ncbi:class I glutamine amidotransferase-like protein [Aulographum hederae CBS 113979]|uniref:Class I glutamine amidotransferase-like protein n=1 Tax=Aulographum hederae CBS 113979 TaxID=1176131 RepID=A0A6G1H0J0_9PEZI|nr:class I glutamine amidotransferase-like protein [Aulographum hederae CBS 113979]
MSQERQSLFQQTGVSPAGMQQLVATHGFSPALAKELNLPLTSEKVPLNYALILFPGFQALDVFGPLDILNMIAQLIPLNLYILGPTLDPISTSAFNNLSGANFSQTLQPTHTFASPPSNIEVLLIPGGLGTLYPENTASALEFLKATFPQVPQTITVCTGSALLAQTGHLDNRRATSNKSLWAWVKSQGPAVQWVEKARWVQDGNLWTSSGISAGMDCVYAFAEEAYGKGLAEFVRVMGEYERHEDSKWDPFAEVWGLGGEVENGESTGK